MKRAHDIEQKVRDLRHPVDARTHDRILGALLVAQQQQCKPQSAAIRPNIGRTIMKSAITKLAAAAVVVIAVTLGSFEFIGGGSTSGVVWAEVARKVQASRGTIFRSTGDRPIYTIHYHSDTQYRNDTYREDQIFRTRHGDFNTGTVIRIDHYRKSYASKTFESLDQGRFWANPKSFIKTFLSHEHRELGAKTIDGVLCEGIETTDPAFAGVSFPGG